MRIGLNFRRAERQAPTYACMAGTMFVLTALVSRIDRPNTAVAAKPPQSTTLSITATGFRNTKGQAIFALFDSPERWLKNEKATRTATVKIAGPAVTVTFTDLQPGVYAASAIHDENENGKLDMRYFPIPRPREGAGVSKGARKRLGPPSWDDAKFVLPDSAYAITIALRY